MATLWAFLWRRWLDPRPQPVDHLSAHLRRDIGLENGEAVEGLVDQPIQLRNIWDGRTISLMHAHR